jgi:putative redox protein
MQNLRILEPQNGFNIENVSSMRVTFPGGKRVAAEFDGFVVETDQSAAHGGDGSAPEPFSLFLASLATCAGIYVLGFCQARGISTQGLAVRQDAVWGERGELREVRVIIDVPPGFPEKYLGAVRAAAAACKVKKVLAAPPEIVVETRVGVSS